MSFYSFMCPLPKQVTEHSVSQKTPLTTFWSALTPVPGTTTDLIFHHCKLILPGFEFHVNVKWT